MPGRVIDTADAGCREWLRNGETNRGSSVVPRKVLIVLVFAYPLLIVSFGVLMGGYALLARTGDSSAALAMWRVGGGCLVLLVVDVVLLIGALGINAIATHRSDDLSR